MRVASPFSLGCCTDFERNRVSMGQEPIYLGNSWHQTHCYRYGWHPSAARSHHFPAVKNVIAAARARGVNVVLTRVALMQVFTIT